MASIEVNQMLSAAAAACEDKKAEDIRILALDPAESGLADYFLICTGTNDRQTVAITDEIEQRLKRDFATYPNSVEGRRQGEWILMDYVDFIVHVFLPEKRAFYGLERLRPSATSLQVADLNAEIKAAIAAHRPAAKAKRASEKAVKASTDSNEAAKDEEPAAPWKGARKSAKAAKPASRSVETATKSVTRKAAAKKSAVESSIVSRAAKKRISAATATSAAKTAGKSAASRARKAAE